MKKKVLKGWITTTRKGKLNSFERGDFILFGCRRNAEDFRDGDNEIVKAVVTVEPAGTQGEKRVKIILDNFSKGSIILIMKAADFINPVKINLPTRAQLLLRWFAISSAGLIAWGDLFLRKGGTK